ncbi:carboxylesterase/lipase family protein [Jiella sonneratiae]|uniref:Carboxylic ester hydrolase n=1 Tax=Jiella sonneratiae TaxID=2816856 RepID=A0ABS3J7L1_9HYPH|nr:carboxylesterase family protein [Jiella sonneratiae]MBO0905649.1 carboxylesterase/lipase family protein [Jiella sonneratiae]
MVSEVRIEAACGRLVGQRRDGVVRFLGIPYAEAPLGQRRFAAPRPKPAFADPFRAFAYGRAAPQRRVLPMPLARFFGVSHGLSEDCLSLNVWTPGVSGRRPVLVFIHGGGFIIGSGAQYPGNDLAVRGDVVVVTMNYRLGLLGFHPFAEVFAGDERFAANPGLLDQRLALAWVRDNIAAFGGDPDAVTIAGESAGSVSVAWHLVTAASQPFYHRAIMQSGTLSLFYGRERAAEIGAELSRGMGLRRGPEPLFQLAPAQLAQAAEAAVSHHTGVISRPYADCIEIGSAAPAALAGRAKPVPLLIGTNRDEFSFFTDLPLLPIESSKAEMTDMVARLAGKDAAARVAGLYGADRAGRIAFGTDLLFLMPSIAFAEAHVASGNAVFAYRLDWEAKGLFARLGATHSVDLPLLFEDFMRPFRSAYLGMTPDHRRRMLAERMRDHWLAFVREGRPGAAWPAYVPETRETMIFNVTDRVEADPEKARRIAWRGIDGFAT